MVVTGIAACLFFRNAIVHRHQTARRRYRLFIGGICAAIAIIYALTLAGVIPTPLPVYIGRSVSFTLGLCLIVVGAVEY